MSRRQGMLFVVALQAFFAGCGGNEAARDGGSAIDGGSTADGGVLPSIILWNQPDNFIPDGRFYDEHPRAFARISRYQTHVSGEKRPDTGHRGSFGTGNGYVFGFVGLTDPVNTLHSMSGPTYEKQDGFYGDYAIFLDETGKAPRQAFDEEWVARSLSSPAIVTRGIRGRLEMDTVDFAPWTSDKNAKTCFIRIVTARNRDTSESAALEISVYPRNPVNPLGDGSLREDRSDHSLYTGFTGVVQSYESPRLKTVLGPVGSGAEKSVVLLHCAGDKALTAWSPPTLDAAVLLDETAKTYSEWESALVQFDLPDPMVEDFLEGMKMTMKVQTSYTGASCPMSEYTRTWTRDNIGPALVWADVGAHEDLNAMIDYMWGAILLNGDLANSYDADMDISVLPKPPDWSSMTKMTGRTAAEGPSHNPIIYGLHHRWTGDVSRSAQRLGMLSRCLFAQDFGVDRLLPYSGDETYRACMNAAFGLPIEYPHEKKNFSSNSTLLWLGAVQDYKMLAAAAGQQAETERAGAVETEVETGFFKHFILDDGCVSAFVERESMTAWPAPFEDQALQVIWSGWMDGDDPFALSSLDCLIGRTRRSPGELVSKLDPKYRDFFPGMKRGMYTGMLPGYTLYSLTETGHPEAQDAFNIASLNIDGSGNLLEDMILDDHSGLSVTYDPVGTIGDYTAKFRPWEGGIVFDAVFNYLLGLKPDAAGKRFSIRPHLPNNWPFAIFRGLRVGESRFDVEIRRTSPGSVRMTVASMAGTGFLFDLRWDSPTVTPPSFAVDGVKLDDRNISRWANFGVPSAKTSPLALPAGGRIVVDASY